MPILAVLGLFLLSSMGKKYGVQPVQIQDLTRKSNYAQVRLTGRVSDEIRFHSSDQEASGGSLEFEVDDGTDTIRIRAYDDVSDEVQKAGKIPGFGDEVVVDGSYQYKARRHFIILGSADDLQIRREKPEAATPIGWLRNPEEKGLKAAQRLKITGRIEDMKSGAYDRRLWVLDPAGAGTAISISAGMLAAHGPDHPSVKFVEGLKAGDYITCYGSLARSRSRSSQSYWQVAPAAPDDLVAADETAWRNDNGNP